MQNLLKIGPCLKIHNLLQKNSYLRILYNCSEKYKNQPLSQHTREFTLTKFRLSWVTSMS